MKIDIVNSNKEAVGSLDLKDEIFGLFDIGVRPKRSHQEAPATLPFPGVRAA